ncbi:MAG: hypothetical protein QOJ66_949 [Ilumatobacteraceae bacterium]|jgi:hypothetical protein
MSSKSRERVIEGFTLFAGAAGELPGVDQFGWADYVGNDVPSSR